MLEIQEILAGRHYHNFAGPGQGSRAPPFDWKSAITREDATSRLSL